MKATNLGLEETRPFYQKLKQAKRKYRTALRDLEKASKDYESAEREYLMSVLTTLKQTHGLNDYNIAMAFGIYPSTLMRWIQADEKTKAEMCENEE